MQPLNVLDATDASDAPSSSESNLPVAVAQSHPSTPNLSPRWCNIPASYGSFDETHNVVTPKSPLLSVLPFSAQDLFDELECLLGVQRIRVSQYGLEHAEAFPIGHTPPAVQLEYKLREIETMTRLEVPTPEDGFDGRVKESYKEDLGIVSQATLRTPPSSSEGLKERAPVQQRSNSLKSGSQLGATQVKQEEFMEGISVEDDTMRCQKRRRLLGQPNSRQTPAKT